MSGLKVALASRSHHGSCPNGKLSLGGTHSFMTAWLWLGQTLRAIADRTTLQRRRCLKEVIYKRWAAATVGKSLSVL